MARVSSFPPVVGDRPRLLVLGSMPGGESLRQGRYYAHPHNRFWPIMGALIAAGPDLDYPERLERLKSAGIALWDVLAHCERTGSLDAAIRPESESPNALADLLTAQPTIRRVAFNGKKAAAAFQRLVLPALPDETKARLQFVTLPSTSPANASIPFERKLEAWRAALVDGMGEPG